MSVPLCDQLTTTSSCELRDSVCTYLRHRASNASDLTSTVNRVTEKLESVILAASIRLIDSLLKAPELARIWIRLHRPTLLLPELLLKASFVCKRK